MFAKRWHQTKDQDMETTWKLLGTSKENTRGSLKDNISKAFAALY